MGVMQPASDTVNQLSTDWSVHITEAQAQALTDAMPEMCARQPSS
jgi:hypothetical protein